MTAFVTVGSTRFDALVREVLSEDVLQSLTEKGYRKLTIQCGNSSFNLKPATTSSAEPYGGWKFRINGVSIEIWRFKPTLEAEYKEADLVISHAGSGTILDVLRLNKPLIVVPNPSLLDNHQSELADALEKEGHLQASTPENLARTISTFDQNKLVPFPPFDGSRFRDFLDKEMGFS